MNFKATHGEVIILSVKKIPDDSKEIITKGNSIKIANSEITGNHHLILKEEGISFYEQNGTLYMKNSVPAKVECVLKERHDTGIIPPGKWEINRKAKEYDHFEKLERSVKD